VLSLAPSTFRTETVPLVDCAGRVIAAPFEARLDLPGFDRSAIDGYAVSCADLKTGAWLPTIGRTAAGEAPGRLCPNSAHRIMTGAPVLDGADAVIATSAAVSGRSAQYLPSEAMCGDAARTSARTKAHCRRGHAGTGVISPCLRRKVCSTFRCCGAPELHCCRAVASFAANARVSHPARSMAQTFRCWPHWCMPAARSSARWPSSRATWPRCGRRSGMRPSMRISF